MLMENPCPGELRPSLVAISFTDPCSTILLGLEIKESECFGATDLTG